MKLSITTLLIFIITINLNAIEPIGLKDVPRYSTSDFNPEDYNLYDIYRFITMKGLPKIYFPEKNLPEYQVYKDKPKPILTKSGIPLVQITNDNRAQDETWIAVNPTNPLNAIATCNDNSTNGTGGQYRMPAYVTFDGGKTWTKYTTQNHNKDAIIRVGSGGATIFDPAITYNKDGKVIYAYGFATDYRNGGENGIFVSVSDDGGVTWNETTGFDNLYQVKRASKGEGLQDRYTIAADWFSEQYEGNVYIAWRDFSSNQSINVAYANKSDYKWWNERFAYTGSQGSQAPVPFVDYKGQIWVSFRLTSSTEKTAAPIYVSTDGGNSYDSYGTAMDNWNIGTPRNDLPPYARVSLATKDSMRMSTNPQLGIDNSNGPYRGNVYCIMPGKDGGTSGPTHIYLATLENGVENPSGAWEVKTIDNNTLGNDMFFPSICVDPVTGYIHVFYYSSQYDPNNIMVDAMYAYSYDGGKTFKHKRLTDESFGVKAVGQQDEGNRYWGDYARIEAYNNRIYPLFWKGKENLNYAHFSNDLFTSLITTAPAAPEIVNLDYNGNNNSVEISWSGIVDGLGEPVTDYTLKLYRNGEFLEEFEKGVSEYVDFDVENGGEYTYGIQVISKDARGEGDIYDFNIIVGGGLTLMPPTNFHAHSHPEGVLFKWNTPKFTDSGIEVSDVHGINIYIEDELVATVPSEQLQAGEFNEFLWETETGQFIENIYATALRERDGEVGESESSNLIPLAYAGAPYSNFKEDFESEEEMVPVMKTGKWGRSEEKASSGQFSLTQSPNENYSPQEDSYIILPPIITTNEQPNLVFDMIALIREKDYVMFEVTNDNGNTWRFGNRYNVSWAPNHWDTENYSLEESDWLLSSLNFIEGGFEDGDTVMVKISFKAIPIPTARGVFIDNMRMDAITSVEEYFNVDANVFPNPAVDEINFSYQLNKASEVKIEVFDLLSNNILTLNKGILKNGEYSEIIKLENLSNGTYFIRISNGIQQKMIPFTISK